MVSQADVIAAVQSGDLEKLQKSLHEDWSLASSKDGNGVSALMHALYRRRADISDLLLRGGPELDIFEATAAGMADRASAILRRDPAVASSSSGDGFTALHFAAFFSRLDIARDLIRHGADLTAVAKNPMKVTPLHSAAAAPSAEIVRILLESGAPANARQVGGWTALHAAAQIGDKDMVRALLEYGADPQARSDDGRTPAQMAEAKGHHEIAKLLS